MSRTSSHLTGGPTYNLHEDLGMKPKSFVFCSMSDCSNIWSYGASYSKLRAKSKFASWYWGSEFLVGIWSITSLCMLRLSVVVSWQSVALGPWLVLHCKIDSPYKGPDWFFPTNLIFDYIANMGLSMQHGCCNVVIFVAQLFMNCSCVLMIYFRVPFQRPSFIFFPTKIFLVWPVNTDWWMQASSILGNCSKGWNL